ncbi:hypothetical protein LOK49_LG12G02628 [Camellia lanceoleosa]|uniref:Uncharacterized protein n=1 Tax=Camellia lanceoleosa TaxID=1840588 RepID=A0ACC0FUY5_9ERIC|nr:hypothetical protein LOK49_LG12G02628 [Camellia lanceoleosa]
MESQPRSTFATGKREKTFAFDSVQAIQAIKAQNQMDPNFNLYQEIGEMLKSDWQCDLHSICRETNYCADMLAKTAINRVDGLETLMTAPLCVELALASSKIE